SLANDSVISDQITKEGNFASVHGEFLTILSEEVRAPLQSMLKYVDLLFNRDLSIDTRQAYLGTIKQAGRQLMTLVNDVHEYSKLESGESHVEKVRVDPTRLVGETLAAFHELAQAKNLSLTAEASVPMPPFIFSDPTRLRQILFAIVGHAIRMTETGGLKVVLRMVDSTPDREAVLVIDLNESGANSDRQQIGLLAGACVPANRSVSRKSGTAGIWLAISQRVAQFLGGKITVASPSDRGSICTWAIPTGLHDEPTDIAPIR
ncbi:MAG TPA: HAMP domain-containing sensor histidine kinase, partial [Schlesneria sp.]